MATRRVSNQYSVPQPPPGTEIVNPYALGDFSPIGMYAPPPQATYEEPAPAPVYDPYDPGTGSAVVEPPRDLATDPGWLALQAEMDREGQLYGAQAQRSSGLVTSNRDRLLADLIPRGEQERTGIEGGMEARGLFGGGQMEEHLARQRANEAQRGTTIQSEAAARLSDIEGQLAMQQAEIERRRAETRADYLSRGYV
jgi:hypothetical protein